MKKSSINSQFTLAILTILATTTLATIKPGPGFKRTVVYKQDSIFFPLDEVFDLSEAEYPMKSHAGNVFFYDTPFASMSLSSYDFKALNYAKTLSPTQVATVYDNSKVLIQNLGMNSKSFATEMLYDLTEEGVDLFCSDVVVNPMRPLIYVGCFPSESSKDQDLRVHTIDYAKKKATHVIKIAQDDGFVVKNRLQLFIGTTSQQSTQSSYMYLYDQGRSIDQKNVGNRQIRLLRNIEFGQVKAYKLLQLANIPALDAIYDYMPYKQGVVITVRTTETPVIYSMIYCSVNKSFTNLDCKTTVKYTAVTKGYIGV